jgi:hypothetical protein
MAWRCVTSLLAGPVRETQHASPMLRRRARAASFKTAHPLLSRTASTPPETSRIASVLQAASPAELSRPRADGECGSLTVKALVRSARAGVETRSVQRLAPPRRRLWAATPKA